MKQRIVLPQILSQLSKYLISGGTAAVVEYALLILLTETAGLWYILSNSIAYACGFILSFFLNRLWVFKSRKNILTQLLQYSLLFAVNLLLNSVLMYLLTSIAGMVYLMSKIFVMGTVVLWNFVLYRKVIYR